MIDFFDNYYQIKATLKVKLKVLMYDWLVVNIFNISWQLTNNNSIGCWICVNRS